MCFIFLSILSFIFGQSIVCRTVIHCKKKRVMVNLATYFANEGYSIGTQNGIRIRDISWKQARSLLSLVLSSRWKNLLSHLLLKIQSVYGLWQCKSLAWQRIQKQKTRGKKITQFCTRMLWGAYFEVPFRTMTVWRWCFTCLFHFICLSVVHQKLSHSIMNLKSKWNC